MTDFNRKRWSDDTLTAFYNDFLNHVETESVRDEELSKTLGQNTTSLAAIQKDMHATKEMAAAWQDIHGFMRVTKWIAVAIGFIVGVSGFAWIMDAIIDSLGGR